MPELSSFSSFGGGFPTTGSITNSLAASGYTAPHTRAPYSESLLMGIAGGPAFGYFSFAYKGHDPQANIVTRNTFQNYGWDASVERLGLTQDVMQSTSPAKAEQKLRDTLESGHAPIVWVDVFTLGYEYSDLGSSMWASTPVVVARYESDGVTLSDRSNAPIVVSKDTFDAARARIKKEKFRLVTLDLPEQPDLASAVRRGMHDAIELYEAKPPKGSGKNWGRAGVGLWSDRLTKSGSKESWEKVFPPGRPFFCGVTSAYRYALHFWEDDTRSADRMMYARFLNEAAAITGERGFEEAAAGFERSASAFKQLGTVLLPERIEILANARRVLDARDVLFRTSGNQKSEELRQADEEFDSLKIRAERELTDPAACAELREEVAAHLELVLKEEEAAFEQLSQALAASRGD